MKTRWAKYRYSTACTHSSCGHAHYYVVFEEPAPNKSVIFVTLVSLTTEYSRSDSRRPASILSVTHSGRTTWVICLAFAFNIFCVFVPFSCCDVKMWVAPDAVCLCRDNILQSRCTTTTAL